MNPVFGGVLNDRYSNWAATDYIKLNALNNANAANSINANPNLNNPNMNIPFDMMNNINENMNMNMNMNNMNMNPTSMNFGMNSDAFDTNAYTVFDTYGSSQSSSTECPIGTRGLTIPPAHVKFWESLGLTNQLSWSETANKTKLMCVPMKLRASLLPIIAKLKRSVMIDVDPLTQPKLMQEIRAILSTMNKLRVPHRRSIEMREGDEVEEIERQMMMKKKKKGKKGKKGKKKSKKMKKMKEFGDMEEEESELTLKCKREIAKKEEEEEVEANMMTMAIQEMAQNGHTKQKAG